MIDRAPVKTARVILNKIKVNIRINLNFDFHLYKFGISGKKLKEWKQKNISYYIQVFYFFLADFNNLDFIKIVFYTDI